MVGDFRRLGCLVQLPRERVFRTDPEIKDFDVRPFSKDDAVSPVKVACGKGKPKAFGVIQRAKLRDASCVQLPSILSLNEDGLSRLTSRIGDANVHLLPRFCDYSRKFSRRIHGQSRCATASINDRYH